jgi:guanine nucleotide-binding protein subunit alpha
MKKIADLPSPLFRSFFNEALRIGEQGYIPTETDVLRARQKSTGITETRFNMGQLS